jgi:hypothetical protein
MQLAIARDDEGAAQVFIIDGKPAGDWIKMHQELWEQL